MFEEKYQMKLKSDAFPADIRDEFN